MTGIEEALLDGLFVVAAAVISSIVALYVSRYQYRDLYARTVSSSRMNWIDAFREEVSILVAVLDTGDQNYRFEAEKARAKLLTRLNQDVSKPGNEYNHVMTELLQRIDFTLLDTDSNKHMAEQIIRLSRKILEPEWQRVKAEARGKKR